MARPIWKGTISFGVISIPVKLYPSTQSKDVSFNQVHDKCKSRIKYKKWCPVDDREVALDEIVRGFEVESGEMVVLTDEDLTKLPVASKHMISLTGFVKETEIDPIYYEKTYYLEPEDAGLKPYALLMRALVDKDDSAVAKIAIRTKERLCVLRPVDGVMLLETLFYPDEIRNADRPKVPDVLVSDQELAMAHSLIDLLEEPFDPDKYEDEYRVALLDMIAAKQKGKQAVVKMAPAATKPADLMAALKASLDAAKKSKPADKAPKRAPTPAPARATRQRKAS